MTLRRAFERLALDAPATMRQWVRSFTQLLLFSEISRMFSVILRRF